MKHPEVDGIFASNDMDAIQLLQVARQRGMTVPSDLQVIGYDGVQLPELSQNYQWLCSH
ncbi:substrate-binding domain-containing protein [Limosilactobacillus agrestimuris]|uniref:substrate-binding domain-containing protein n=1 Tax=Limosilactobacillus agrestimuris TaxID=2941331 RepID=UPI00203E1016|nr:substrate-binding domain-containing protein [Limosilactobacillus agrestimuris]